MKTIFNFIAATVLGMSVVWLTGCPTSSDPVPTPENETPAGPTTSIPPASVVISGNGLACDTVSPYVSDGFTSTPPENVSDDEIDGTVWKISDTPNHPNIGNNPKRLAITVDPALPTGEAPEEWTGEAQVHPLLVSYAEQVIGDYELGDGSADIGDLDNIDEIFVSLSLDNGKSWKKYQVSDSAEKSSRTVTWDYCDAEDLECTLDGVPESNVPYPGHSHKPTMAVSGNKIAVAWLDKWCQKADPFGLDDDPENIVEDYFKVNGNQGAINYNLPCTVDDPDALDYNCAPNGKAVYEVPYSCVWTARGEFVQDEDTQLWGIEWRSPQQLTSGARDANKIAIAASAVGFAYVWQEDPEGLRAGKGAGPGHGWSGATTNHGADIWFSKINMDDYLLVVDDTVETKWVPLVNYDYPVRITDNEKCNGDTDNKLYCADYCDGTECVTNDLDMLSLSRDDGPYNATLDGDTGASRPAMKILKTDATVTDDDGNEVSAEEYVVILGYEETKGLSETIPQDPNQDQGDTEVSIEDEGKSVYFESFLFPTVSVMEAAAAGALPVISAGNIVNVLTPLVTVSETDDGDVATETSDTNFENARRLVIMAQVDPCEASEGDYTFGFLYKQGIYTQGGPSDMFIRMNTGFSYDTFEGTVTNEDDTAVTNISSHEVDDEGNIVWTEANLLDESYTIIADNTFSPRGWLRGSDIITGYEYTPNWDQSSHGCIPNDFHTNRYVDGIWHGPQNISNVQGPCVSTLDPRFHPTPKGKDTGLDSDRSAPDTIIMVYGTYDMLTGEELDLYYTRSTDIGATWETVVRQSDGALVNDKLAARDGVQEKEAQCLVSPDGTMLYTVWNQEYDPHEHPDVTVPERFLGLDSWLGRVDYVVTSQ